MKTLKRTFVLLSAVSVAAVATLAGTATAGTTKYESFRAQGLVESSDTSPETPIAEEFRIGAPVNNFGNLNLERAKNADGSLDVRPQPTTKYYRFDVTRGRYVKGTYADTVVPGFEVRVHGDYGKAGSEYEALANTVYQPPKNITPNPANPPCSTAKDFTFGRRFNARGDVTQEGYNLTNLGVYSDFFGFVLGNLASTNNAHVAAVAAHDSSKLGINTILTGEQNTVTGYKVPFTTRYRKQDPTTLKWSESTKDEAVTRGALIQSGGRYGCELNDWRFLAQFVWNPVRGAASGNVQFNEVTRRTANGTSGPGSQDDTQYDGNIVTGDETVAAGSPFALDNVDWVFNPTTNLWDFDGEWTFTNTQGFGTLIGDVGGTWDAASGDITGTVLMTSGSGRYNGYVGAGTLAGSGLPALGGGAPSTFDGKWIINVM